MQCIHDNIFLFEDTCSVYVVKNGDQAVLVDFGSGEVLEHVGLLGITQVTDVLITHHHRDQVQGLAKAVAKGVRVWVPHMEQDLFHSVNEHWQAREILNNYNGRQDRFSLLQSVKIHGTLKDYGRYEFAGFLWQVIPTPGHTTGSISLILQVHGEAYAFVGDLMYQPGKLWSLAATQWTYNGGEGIALTAASLLDLKKRKPRMVLPGHGQPFGDPVPGIDLLLAGLKEMLEYRGHNLRLWMLEENPYEEITPHLLRNRTSMADSYVLKSRTGQALVIDYGYDFIGGIPAGWDRASRRPWLYTLDRLKQTYGVERVSVAIPTHFHDDHVAGFNLLRDVEGTEVWANQEIAQILVEPNRYDLPCLWYDPIPVDRVIPLNEPIAWEEYKFTLFPLPGHTKYAVAIGVEVDGQRVLFTGDQYQGEKGELPNHVYANRYEIGDYVASAELLATYKPDLILSGHWGPIWTQEEFFATVRNRGTKLKQLHNDLLPRNTVDFGAGGFAARIEPYHAFVAAGDVIDYDVELRNPFSFPCEAKVVLIIPDDWLAAEKEIKVDMGSKAKAMVKFQITIPKGISVRRERIGVDVSFGLRRFGEQAEALISTI